MIDYCHSNNKHINYNYPIFILKYTELKILFVEPTTSYYINFGLAYVCDDKYFIV